jgi:hypothetical protein
MPGNYDLLFKSLAEDDPRGFLHLFAGRDFDEQVIIEPIPREVGLPVLEVDHAYRVQGEGGSWIEHLEQQTWWKNELPERTAWHGAGLTFKYRLPVRTTMVLISQKGAPRSVPESGEVSIGRLRVEYRYDVVKLWEVAAERALCPGHPKLLPWVLLMRASHEEIRRAVRWMREVEDPNLLVNFRVLGGLRYDEDEFQRLLEKAGAMITEEDIMKSSWVRSVREQWTGEGIEKGIEKGLLQGALGSLRNLLRARFPGLESLPQLDALADPAKVQQLVAEVSLSPDENTAKELIFNASKS